MTINVIISEDTSNLYIPATDLQDGVAYMSSDRADNRVYIGNQYDDIKAFSTDGNAIVLSDSPDMFYEVDIEITVKRRG